MDLKFNSVHFMVVFDRAEILDNGAIVRFRRAESLCHGGPVEGPGTYDWKKVSCKHCKELRKKWEEDEPEN